MNVTCLCCRYSQLTMRVACRALHYAAQFGLVSVVQLLITKGANAMLPDANGTQHFLQTLPVKFFRIDDVTVLCVFFFRLHSGVVLCAQLASSRVSRASPLHDVPIRPLLLIQLQQQPNPAQFLHLRFAHTLHLLSLKIRVMLPCFVLVFRQPESPFEQR